MKHNFKQKKGFTLVELLVVIVIIGILFVVLVSRVDFSSNNARTSGVQTDMRSFQTAIRVVALKEQGLNDNVFQLVESLNNSLDEHLALEVKDGVIQSNGTDPWGTEYRLEYTKPDNTLGQIVIVSAGPDTEFGTKDDTRSVVRYEHTKSGGQVVIDDEVIPVESLVKKDLDLIFKNRINTNELITVFEKCSSKSTSALMGGEFTTYVLAEDATYKLLASYRALDGIAVLKYERAGTSYWYLNKKAAAHVGATEGWNVYDGSTYTPHTGNLGIKFVESTTVNFYSIDDMTLLFYGHICSYEEEVVSDDYMEYAGNCVKQSKYYYSCTCGEIGAATFDGGLNPDVHAGETYQRYVELDADFHSVVTFCYECDAEIARVDEAHIEDGIGGCVLCPANLHVCVFDRTATNPQFIAVEATCTTPAKYYYSCGCGTAGTEMFESGQPLGHIGGTLTCTQDRVCSRCGVTYETAPGHNYTRKTKNTSTLRTPASCEEPATYWYACAHTYLGCSAISTSDWWTDEGSATGHTYNQKNTDSKFHYSDATCVSPAKYYYSCSCGEKGTELFDHGEINPDNHVGGVHNEYEEIDDTNHYRYEDCNSCDAVLNTYTEPHQKDASETCTLCSRHVHNFERTDNLYLHSAATCTTKAVYYYNCICNARGDDTYETGGVLGHSMGQWYTTTPAACTSGGEKRRDCQRSNCTHYETEPLDALGHDYTKQNATNTYLKSDATCTEPAHYYKSCQHCGGTSKDTAYESEFTYGAANGHKFDYQSDRFLKTAATCTEHAVYWFECSVCGIQSPSTYYIKDNTAKGHDLLETINSANCEVNGIKVITCQRTGCGYSTSETLVAPGHNFDTDGDGEDNWTVELYPTCTVDGSETAVCQNSGCGHVKRQVIPRLGHSIETIPFEAETCTTDGHEIQYHCTREDCGKYFSTVEATTEVTLASTIRTKIGHAYVNAICTREGCNEMAPPGAYTNGTCTSGLTWEQCVANGYVNVTEDGILTKLYTPSNYTQIVLPETVTQLGDPNATSNTFTSAASQRSITSITGAQNVTAINDYAFASNSTTSYYRTKLVNIDTDESLTYVGKRAFYYCSSLKEIELSNVETIGDQAFYCCSSLQTADLSSLETLGTQAFYQCSALTSVENIGEIAIPDYAFWYCNNLSTIDLSHVTSIGNSSFAVCSSLPTTVSLNNCSSLGEYAFGGTQSSHANQSSVKVIENLGADLPEDEFVSIANNAFKYNSNIETIDLSKVNSLGTYSFYYASKLNAPDFGDHITTIPQFAFSYAGQNAANKALVIADQITTIDQRAFDHAYYTSLTFEESSQITTIGDYAFYYAQSIDGTISFPSTISYIGNHAFYYCRSIDSLEWEGATNLSIGTSAFFGNQISGTLTLPEGTKTVAISAFGSNSITSVVIPSTLTSIGTNPWCYNYSLSSFTVSSDNPTYHVVQNSLVDKSDKNVVSGTINSNLSASSSLIDGIDNSAFQGINYSNGTIPSNISTIGSQAFYGANLGSSLYIPSSVYSIGSEAFCGNGVFSSISSSSSSYPEVSGCLMSGNKVLYGEPGATIPSTATSISCCAFMNGGSYTIPSSVTSIGTQAFYNCDIITFANVDSITSINSYAFYGINNTSFTFPANSSFKTIQNHVLYNSSVTTVYIPVNVTSIVSSSSYYPLGSATSIIYSGTLNQWLSISKTPSYVSSASYTVSCSNGSITKDGTVSIANPLHEVFDLINVNDSEIKTIECGDGTYTVSGKSFATTGNLSSFVTRYGSLMSNFNSISSSGQFSITVGGTIDVSSGGTSSSDFASIYTSIGSPSFTKLITSDLTMEKDSSTSPAKWKISSSTLTAETALSRANNYVSSPPIKKLDCTDVTIEYVDSSGYKYTCNGTASTILSKYGSTYTVRTLTSDDLTIAYYNGTMKSYTYTGTAVEFMSTYGTTYGSIYSLDASDATLTYKQSSTNIRYAITYEGSTASFLSNYSAMGSPGIYSLSTNDLTLSYSSGTSSVTYRGTSSTLTDSIVSDFNAVLSYTCSITGLPNQAMIEMLNDPNLQTISTGNYSNNVNYVKQGSWDFSSLTGVTGVKIVIMGETESTNFDWICLAAGTTSYTSGSTSTRKFITTGGSVASYSPSSSSVKFGGAVSTTLTVNSTYAIKGCVILKTDTSVTKSGLTVYVIPIISE